MTPSWFPSLVKLTLISGAVYLSFQYLLPLAFPFLLAYVLMRLLWPAMTYLHEKQKWPFLFSHYLVLFAFFGSILSSFLFLLWKIFAQLQLFFTNFPIYRQMFMATFSRQTAYLCKCTDYYFHLGAGTTYAFCCRQVEQLQEKYSAFFTKYAGKALFQCVSSSFHVCFFVFLLAISMVILLKEMPALNQGLYKSPYYSSIHTILIHLKKSGFIYLRTEGIILLLNWFLCSLGLFLIGNPYFFLLGMGIAVFDAFPVLGSGLILFPWSFYLFLNQSYFHAAILMTTYLTTLFVREFLEAKIMGNGMGLSPFFMLAAIFVGIELFGVTGIFLGPLAVVLIRSIYKEFCLPNPNS